MARESEHYPWYGFERNRGTRPRRTRWPSPLGCTPFHRKSWAFVEGLLFRPEAAAGELRSHLLRDRPTRLGWAPGHGVQEHVRSRSVEASCTESMTGPADPVSKTTSARCSRCRHGPRGGRSGQDGQRDGSRSSMAGASITTVSRGPGKGGIRFHQSVTANDGEGTGRRDERSSAPWSTSPSASERGVMVDPRFCPDTASSSG